MFLELDECYEVVSVWIDCPIPTEISEDHYSKDKQSLILDKSLTFENIWKNVNINSQTLNINSKMYLSIAWYYVYLKVEILFLMSGNKKLY